MREVEGDELVVQPVRPAQQLDVGFAQAIVAAAEHDSLARVALATQHGELDVLPLFRRRRREGMEREEQKSAAPYTPTPSADLSKLTGLGAFRRSTAPFNTPLQHHPNAHVSGGLSRSDPHHPHSDMTDGACLGHQCLARACAQPLRPGSDRLCTCDARVELLRGASSGARSGAAPVLTLT